MYCTILWVHVSARGRERARVDCAAGAVMRPAAAAMLVLPALLLGLLGTVVQPGAAAPCDILGDASPPTPCVAAHSTTRALYAAYAGPLYQVRRASDGREIDVRVATAGGFADAAAQDKFCGVSACHIWMIYDQSPRHNHLHIAPPGGNHKEEDAPVNASRESLTVGGHRVYAVSYTHLTLPTKA